jgi:hypothetical protein
VNGPEPGGMTPADLEVAEGIRLEYRRKQRNKRLGNFLLIGVLLVGIVTLVVAMSSDLVLFSNGFAFFAVIGGMLTIVMCFWIFQMINWRCPRCQKGFGSQRNPRFCANCGVRLRE